MFVAGRVSFSQLVAIDELTSGSGTLGCECSCHAPVKYWKKQNQDTKIYGHVWHWRFISSLSWNEMQIGRFCLEHLNIRITPDGAALGAIHWTPLIDADSFAVLTKQRPEWIGKGNTYGLPTLFQLSTILLLNSKRSNTTLVIYIQKYKITICNLAYSSLNVKIVTDRSHVSHSQR